MPQNTPKMYEIRYVLDVGSSNTKTMCCLVNTHTSKVVMVLDQYIVPFNYQSHISSSKDGRTLSHEAMMLGKTAMTSILEYYKIDASEFNTKCAGIATAWARNAHNAQTYLDLIEKSLGIRIDIASQAQEGELGIKALMASSTAHNMNDTLVWDIGGGSFQLSYLNDNGDINVYNGPYGSLNFAHELRNKMGLEANTILTKNQTMIAIGFTQSIVGDQLKNYENLAEIQSKASTCAIGQFMNAGLKPLINADKVTKQDLLDLIDEMSEYSANELIELYPSIKPEFVYNQQTNLILVHGIMEATGMEEIEFCSSAQSMHAIAVNDDLWKDGSFHDIWNAEEAPLVTTPVFYMHFS